MAAVELAVLAPVLVMVLVCTVDLGFGIWRKMQVQNAAQTGAAYAAKHGFNGAAVSSAVTGTSTAFAISASPPPRQFCGCAAETGITETACDATCSNGVPCGTYVEASAQGVYATIIPYPMVENSFTFTAQSTVRLQ